MRKLGFIGAGNMAGALVKGLLATKRYRPRDLWVADSTSNTVYELSSTGALSMNRNGSHSATIAIGRGSRSSGNR